MDKAHIIDHFRSQLAREVLGQGGSLPRFNPMNISPWLAMSLMQKAIRRGREELALQAAATLLNQAPDRLWRRLCVTAFEDIGVGDFDTIALMAAALIGKRWRTDVGGDWAVASYLVVRMCGSIKCRAADDLAYVCERHTRFEAARLAWAFEPLPRLLGQITSDAPIPERGIALWYALGTNRYNTTALRERRGEPQAAFDGLCEHGFPDTVVEVCRVGFRKCSEIITAFIILLHREVQNATCHVEPDDLPAEVLIGTGALVIPDCRAKRFRWSSKIACLPSVWNPMNIPVTACGQGLPHLRQWRGFRHGKSDNKRATHRMPCWLVTSATVNCLSIMLPAHCCEPGS